MASTPSVLFIFYLHFFTALTLGGSAATSEANTLIKAENSCDEMIWVAVVSAPESPELPSAATGFPLLPGDSVSISVPLVWSGSAWARTRCVLDPAGAFLCLTGDCGSGGVPCPRGTPVPPPAATVASFVAVEGGHEFFVSAMAGFNLEVAVSPKGGTGARCVPTGRVGLNMKACPVELRFVDGDGTVVGCKSGAYTHDDDDDDDEAIVSPTFACFSASYVLQFCAVGFRKHTDVNPDESEGSKKENSGNKVLAWVKGLGSLGGVGTLAALLWWVVKKFCTRSTTSGGSFNGPTNVNCFNFFYRANPTLQSASNDRPRELQLKSVKIGA